MDLKVESLPIEKHGHKRISGFRRVFKRMVLILIILVIAIAGLSRIFPQSTRRLTATTVENLFLRYQALGAGTGSFLSGAPSKQAIMAPLRDGVQLATDLYLPRGKEIGRAHV